jgi:hypothetical protein
MAMMPPFDPLVEHQTDQEGGAQSPEIHYVSSGEADEEDRVTSLDKLAIVAAIGVAQLIRLAIIFGAVGIVILIFFIGSKL